MPITIPNRNNLRPTTTPKRFPATAKSAMTNPGPVGVAVTGASASGMPLAERTDTIDNYCGFNIRADVPAGSQDEEAFAPISGCIVEGFAGVAPGSPVFIDETAAPDPEAAFSGLTHTEPVAETVRPAGFGCTPTKIHFYEV